MSDRKYALLIAQVPGDEDGEFDLGDARARRGNAADLVAVENTKHWRDWLGSVRWDELMAHEHRLVMRTVPTERPRVLDAENNELSAELRLAWRALLLAAPQRPLSGEAWVLTGDMGAGDRPLSDVRGIEHLGPIIRPWYASRHVFFGRRPWRDGDPWATRWADIFAHLRSTYDALPEIAHMAAMSYFEGLHQREIEFRIPTFVRAAEAVLAIPKKSKNVPGGAVTFAERVLRVVPNLATHWCLGGSDATERLRQLYEHRNECVHGKIPFVALRAKGDLGADEAAMFEYLAELVARQSVLFGLWSAAFHGAARDRATLEAAWAAGNIA